MSDNLRTSPPGSPRWFNGFCPDSAGGRNQSRLGLRPDPTRSGQSPNLRRCAPPTDEDPTSAKAANPRGRMLCVLFALLASAALAAESAKPEKVREIFVPYEDLSTLMEGNSQRVFLTRQEYDDLLAKAKKKPPEIPAPQGALLLAAEYDGTIEEGRVRLSGAIDLEVLEEGLHALPLDMSGVGVRRAAFVVPASAGSAPAGITNPSAPIARDAKGQTILFVEGIGRHRLLLEMVAPLQTSAAQQSLTFRLPTPAAARLRLVVPGNVEVKSGAKVVSRTLDEAAGVTRFELLLPKEQLSLVMSLNNRMLRQQRVVVARSVLVDEITSAYERLHTTVSFDVLHGAADRFRLALPEGFEPTEVLSPLLSRWAVATVDNQRVLEIVLREPSTETVVLNVSATRTPARLQDWTMPQLTPLDMAGQVAVVGLIVEDQLSAEGIESQGLVPVDNRVLTAALPETVFRAEPGAPRVRPVATYYAPLAKFALQAGFRQPPPRLQVTTNVLLVLDDQGHHVRGGFALLPQIEKLFAVHFTAPAGWNVTQVTAADGKPLAVERYDAPQGESLIHVRLPQGIPPGEVTSISFQAESVPPDWLGQWPERTVAFPRFVVENTTRDTGAVAIRADDDLLVRPNELAGLDPLDDKDKENYGLAGVESNLAYRYEVQPYAATVHVTRTQPTITARTFSFLQIAPEGLTAHYEILYDIRQARARQLTLRLPKATPTSLSIRGAEGATVKDYTSEERDDERRWTALLAEPVNGVVRLAVDFQQPLPDNESKESSLPLARADGVAYQSAVVAVEGNAELDITVKTDARTVDVGELVAAQYAVGKRLLGVFESVGPPQAVQVDVDRRPGYGLPPAIVQRAELDTVLSADGTALTGVRYLLRTKAAFLEVRLPAGSELWSAYLDGQPVAPQRDGDRLLLDLPASAQNAMRDLQVIYQTPLTSVVMLNRVATEAPTLWLRNDRDAQAGEVPTADVTWNLLLPEGHRLVRSSGTVYTQQLETPRSPIWNALGGLFFAAGGVPGLLGGRAREAASRAKDWAASPACQLSDEVQSDMAPSSALMTPSEGLPREESIERLAELSKKEERMPQSEAESQPEAAKDSPPADATADPFGATQDPFGAPRPSSPKPAAGQPADQPAAPPPPQRPAAGEEVAQVARPARDAKYWALEGVRSLPIDLQKQGDAVTFQSLGVRPLLRVTIANARRFDMLAWSVGLAVFAAGLLLTRRSVRTKTRYVVLVSIVALALPLATGLTYELGKTFDCAFYAACCLVLWYLIAAALRWLCPQVGESLRDSHPVSERPAHVASSLLLALIIFATANTPAVAQAPKPPAFDPSGLIELLTPPKPIRLPADAVIIPYDAEQGTDGLKNADKVLVPYAKYVELWNRAFPDKKLQAKPPITAWSLAGATYEATLSGDDYLLVTGRLEVDVYTERPVQVPLRLSGGVLTSATIGVKPARLQLVQPAPQPAPQPGQQQQQAVQTVQASAPPDPVFAVLHLAGKGRQQLALQIRLRLERRGGWRVAVGRLPTAPAAGLTLTVPAAGTEVRLAGLADRGEYETAADNQQIATALSDDGRLNLQWRPKVAEGQVDRSLTVASEAVLDVQEDGLRLVWQLNLEFPRSRRDRFEVLVPAGYLVERVLGDNVRMWDLKQADNLQRLNVTLLKETADRERVTLHLSRRGVVAADQPTQVPAPAVSVDGAVLHKGRLTIRRSPLLELRATSVTGLSRTDIAADVANALTAAGAAEESPLGLRPYQAFEFGAISYALALEAAPVPGDAPATVQSLLRIAERETRLETQVKIDVRTRPVHRVRLYAPATLEVEQVVAPGEFTWAATEADGRRLVCVYLGSGQSQPFSVVVRGSLGRRQAADPVPAPKLEVLDVVRQQGDLVVQVDPAFDVRAAERQNCDTIPVSNTFDWLQAEQRPLARLVLRYQTPQYDARFEVRARPARVSGYTITNVKVTDVAVEETVSIDLTIREAGIREVLFTLPAGMEQARISAPKLRQKTIQDAADGRKLFRLELQDDTLGQYRVLVENERVLLSGGQLESELQTAPIPELQTGRTDQRYVTLENAGRDEVLVVDQVELGPLSRQQAEWRKLAEILGENLTSAYLVAAEAKSPQLTFKTKQRKTVETARASIGLGETLLVVDAAGAYRGQQTYHVHNTTEQFLEIRLPPGAQLWTAIVAGQPVKPTEVPVPHVAASLRDADRSGATPDQVRIPLIKTAEGDTDYAVVLKYGGWLQPIGIVDRVAFPLMRTVNINVELSRVRLRVPETHTWFDFGGTMRPVFDKGSYEADFFSYNAKQVKRLMQTLNTDNYYARARSMSNLKQLGLAVQNYQQQFGDYSSNDAFKRNLEVNADLIRQAEQQTQEILAKEGEAIVTDNRGRLNTYFQDQKNASALNVVNELGGNFRVVTKSEEGKPAADKETFNYRWLETNKLENRERFEKKDADVRFGKQVQVEAGDKLKSYAKGQSLLGDISSESGAQVRGKRRGDVSEPESRSVAQSQQELARRYQQKLQTEQQMDQVRQQQAGTRMDDFSSLSNAAPPPANQQPVPLMPGKPGMPGMMMPGQGATDAYGMMPGMAGGYPGQGPTAAGGYAMSGGGGMGGMGAMGGGIHVGRDESRAAGRLNAGQVQSGMGGAVGGVAFSADGKILATQDSDSVSGLAQQPTLGYGARAAETHLASLDVDLPLRGREYLFTTSRGDIDITARAVSEPLLGRLTRLLAVAVGFVVLLVLLRVLPRVLRLLHGSRWFAAAVLLVGLLSLLLGVFPILALAALIYGLVQLVRLEIARCRRRAAASVAAA